MARLCPTTDWRQLSSYARYQYRVLPSGRIAVRSQVPGLPPFDTGSTFYAWAQETAGTEEWVLRTGGPPTTMQRIHESFYGMVRSASDRLAVDERILLTTIACESGRDASHPSGRDVRSPRTELGYPRRIDERDPGDPARDAEDWQNHLRTGAVTHSSHGLMQTLISTAVAACPRFFVGRDPSQYRSVLWDPAVSIECGATYYKGFPADDKLDPVRARFRYGAGAVYPTSRNDWGARIYELQGRPAYAAVVWNWLAFWNDGCAVLDGTEGLNARQIGFVSVGALLTLLAAGLTVAGTVYAARHGHLLPTSFVIHHTPR